MKKVGFIFTFVFFAVFAFAQDSGNNSSSSDSDVNVCVTIDENDDGSFTVTSTATSTTEKDHDGSPLSWGSQDHAEEGELDETVARSKKSAKDGLSKRIESRKNSNGVMLGPDGQGDMRNGGTFPPEIVIIIGDMPQGLKMGKETIQLKYRNESQFNSNISRDLRGALAKL
jgi:hypothetical protein